MADSFDATATSVEQGREAAARLDADKRDKYEEITRSYSIICLVAVETIWDQSNRDLLSAIYIVLRSTQDNR